MIEIERVKKDDILITEEFRSGQRYFVYGPVVEIDQGTNEVGIRTMEGNRLFPVAKLWTIPAFIIHKIHEVMKDRREQWSRFIPNQTNQDTRILAGFVATVLKGDVDQKDIKDILDIFEKKGIKPTRNQEALEVLINL